jgi:hypothetical protein
VTAFIVKTARDPDYRLDEDRKIVEEGSWAPFVLEDSVGERYFMRLYEDFPDFQFMLYDGETPVAAGNSIPVVWDLDEAALSERGWDWALESGFDGLVRGIKPTTACALSMTIAKEYQGKGVSGEGLWAMKNIARRHGLKALIRR